MCAELYLALRRANTGNLSKIAVRHVVVRVLIADKVKGVEEIGTETNHVLFHDVKVFEDRGIDLAVAGCAFGVDGRGAEGKRSGGSVGTDSVVSTRGARYGGGVSSPPVCGGTVMNLQGAVVVCSCLTECIGIGVAGTVDGNGKSRVGEDRT